MSPSRTDAALECVAAVAGLSGAFLLASATPMAAWGWLAFLASNGAWIAFAVRRRLRWLLLQQIGFTGTSILGIYNWMIA